YYHTFSPTEIAKAPKAYIIPQGWWTVTDLLKLNGVKMKQFEKDTMIEVVVSRIESYKSLPYPYEKHHVNSQVETSEKTEKIRFLKGDYYIELNQPANRYLVETLDPRGGDSFFAWNFFDGIL